MWVPGIDVRLPGLVASALTRMNHLSGSLYFLWPESQEIDSESQEIDSEIKISTETKYKLKQ